MAKVVRNTRRRLVPSTAVNPNPTVLTQLASFESQTKLLPIAPRSDLNSTTINFGYTCACCSQPIHERYLLYTEDRLCRGNYWHMQCLRCQCCNVVLADVASTFYSRDNGSFCKSDYFKRYTSRPCTLCSQMIGQNETIMRINAAHVYHLSCFICVKCRAPLLKGDRYVLCNGQPFCEKDNPMKSKTKRIGRRSTTTSTQSERAQNSVELQQPSKLTNISDSSITDIEW